MGAVLPPAACVGAETGGTRHSHHHSNPYTSNFSNSQSNHLPSSNQPYTKTQPNSPPLSNPQAHIPEAHNPSVHTPATHPLSMQSPTTQQSSMHVCCVPLRPVGSCCMLAMGLQPRLIERPVGQTVGIEIDWQWVVEASVTRGSLGRSANIHTYG